MEKLLTSEELEGRINCFGEFDHDDKICLKTCAMNINCAIAKDEYFNFQFIDDNISSLFNFSTGFYS